MAAKLFYLPFPTAFNTDGLAVPNAKLEFYLSGGSTPTPSYTSSLLTTQHPWPVVSNGAGRFAGVYLNDALTYRLVIKDASGVTLDDIDPFVPGTLIGATGAIGTASGLTALFSTIAGTTISSTVTSIQTSGYSSAGVGGATYIYDAAVTGVTVAANPRTQFLAADLRGFRLDTRQRLIVQMTGAFGDDSTDCTTAFQAMITAAGNNPVFIPLGRYRITAKITSSLPVNVQGAGNATGPGAAEQFDTYSTVIVANFANPTIFEITTTRGSIFRDFKVDVEVAFRGPTSGALIRCTATGTGTVAHGEIHNVSLSQGYQCISITRPAYWKITGNYFGEWVQDAVYMDTDSAIAEGSAGYITNNFFYGKTGVSAINQRSCVYLGCAYAIIRDNEILGAQAGVRVGIINFPAGFLRIQNNTIEEQAYWGVYVTTTANIALTMVAIIDNEFSCIDNFASYLASIFIEDNAGVNYIQSMHVGRNVFRSQLAAGRKHIAIGNGRNVSVCDNIIEELGANTPTAILINGTASNAGLIGPIIVSNNTVKGTVIKYTLAASVGVQVIDYQGLTFAQLPANAGNGSQVFCTDGTFANPVAAAGTGCIAKMLNGAWRGD